VFLAGAMAGALAVLAACDPCAGVIGCVTPPRVAIQGRLVDVVDGHGVSGARVSLVRTDVTPHDSTSTVTDGDGNYQVDLATGSGTFDVDVAPLGLPAYQVHGLALASSTRSGNGHVLGVWVTRPIFATALELIRRTDGGPVTSGTVTFRRTGGVAISGDGLVNGTFTTQIDPSGRVALLSGVYALGTDDVIGELTIDTGDPIGPSIIPDFRIAARYEFRPRDVLRMAVGPRLDWGILIYDRATVVGVPGTVVSFRRTGGIATSAESFTITSDANGQIHAPLIALETGTVIGDLTITPPPPFHSYVKTGLQLHTFEDAVAPSFRFGVGPHLPWLGVVQCHGQPLQGATVVVVRVGGISATPTSSRVTSNEIGNFSLVFRPADYGDLIVDLAVTPPPSSGCIGYVQHGLHLPTLDIDSDARFIAAWDLPTR
jgi:hypothetical protein